MLIQGLVLALPIPRNSKQNEEGFNHESTFFSKEDV
jgi:hypothetical protein